jgi:hypothetical protein
VKRTGHGSNPVEGDYNAGKYIIVDDFIATGDTCHEIMQEIDECYSMKYNGGTAVCVGVLQAYFFAHPECREFRGHPDIFDTTLVNGWHQEQSRRRQRQQEQAKEERMKTEQAIARMRKTQEEPRCEVSMNAEGRSTWPSKTYAEIDRDSWDQCRYMGLFRSEPRSLSSLLDIMGLPPEPKRLEAPKGPLKTYVAKEKARLAKLKSDRDNFNARMSTGPQRSFPRITSSSLRNISR